MSGDTVSCVTTTGDSIELSLDTSDFGFPCHSIVHFTKSRYNGKIALIRGVKDGMLWFAMFPNEEAVTTNTKSAMEAPVQTTSCRGKEEYIRQYGWMVATE